MCCPIGLWGNKCRFLMNCALVRRKNCRKVQKFPVHIAFSCYTFFEKNCELKGWHQSKAKRKYQAGTFLFWWTSYSVFKSERLQNGTIESESRRIEILNVFVPSLWTFRNVSRFRILEWFNNKSSWYPVGFCGRYLLNCVRKKSQNEPKNVWNIESFLLVTILVNV